MDEGGGCNRCKGTVGKGCWFVRVVGLGVRGGGVWLWSECCEVVGVMGNLAKG